MGTHHAQTSCSRIKQTPKQHSDLQATPVSTWEDWGTTRRVLGEYRAAR